MCDLVVALSESAPVLAETAPGRRVRSIGTSLAGEAAIPAVQAGSQDRGDLGVTELGLLGPGLAEDHGVHGFKVRGIGGEGQVHDVAVELPIR